jgi:hypothetical protein
VSSQRTTEEETITGDDQTSIGDDQTSIGDDQPPSQRIRTEHERSPVSTFQLSAEEIRKTIVDAVVDGMEARDKIAAAGNNGGPLGTKIDENTTN